MNKILTAIAIGGAGAGTYALIKSGSGSGSDNSKNKIGGGGFLPTQAQGSVPQGVAEVRKNSDNITKKEVTVEAPEQKPVNLYPDKDSDSGYDSDSGDDSDSTKKETNQTEDSVKSTTIKDDSQEKDQDEKTKKEKNIDPRPPEIQLAPDTGGQGTISDSEYMRKRAGKTPISDLDLTNNKTKKEDNIDKDQGGFFSTIEGWY